MSTGDWAALVAVVSGAIGAVYAVVRVMVGAIMREFAPNGGTSLKDQVNRIEARLDALYEKMID